MKGFMCYVEGQGSPTFVHADFAGAYHQMKVLAEKFPGKEVFMFALRKRCKLPEGAEKTEPLPCHLPPGGKSAKLDELVYKKDAKIPNGDAAKAG